MDWAGFNKEGALASPGDRRAMVVPFIDAPTLEPDGDVTWLEFALPAGSYATEVLAQSGIRVPEDRSGRSAPGA